LKCLTEVCIVFVHWWQWQNLLIHLGWASQSQWAALCKKAELCRESNVYFYHWAFLTL
jgi:hypothetical protein